MFDFHFVLVTLSVYPNKEGSMNIKKQLLYFFLVFLFQNSSFAEEEINFFNDDDNLTKSFTAICANNEEDSCTYSVAYSSTSPTTGYSGNSRISVNELLHFDFFTVANSTNPKIFNIKVRQNDEILIGFLPSQPKDYTLYNISATNGPDGTGITILNSRSNTIDIRNVCPKGEIRKYTIATDDPWDQELVMYAIVNDNVVTIFDGTSVDFTVKYGDKVSILVLYQQGNNIPYGYNAYINTDDPVFSRILTWYSNSYYELMMITNKCKLPISPFGGSLYPITRKQTEEFLENQMPSDSIIWESITTEEE